MTRFYDWAAIRLMYERGKSACEIERTEGMPTRQGVMRRAKAEGWTRNGPVTEDRNEISTVERAMPDVPQFSEPCPEFKRQVVQHLRQGKTFAAAAAKVGRTDRCLRQWREDDAVFAAYCEVAQAEMDAALQDTLYGGALKNPNLALKTLQVRRSSRQDFTRATNGTGDNGPHVIIFARNGGQDVIDVNNGRVIEHIPEPAAAALPPPSVASPAGQNTVSAQAPAAESSQPARETPALRHDPLGRSR